MRIAVIGMGSVGATLGRRWAELGHHVTFGARDPGEAKAKTLVSTIKGKAAVARVAEAVAASEVVVLATPWQASADALASAGDLAGKILVDVTNPLEPDLRGLALGHDSSGAEEIAKLARRARVYKALNQTGFENMADPVFPGGRAVMFVAGDEPEGKAAVLKLVAELGFEAVDAGALKVARLLEPLAMLWIQLMLRRSLGRRFAFGLLRKDA
jgi:8-hydroxy-5-deazaflavin:NADPH oxidoreductase